MNKKKTVAIHVICWLIYLSYRYLGILLHANNLQEHYFSFSIVITEVAEFYICYLWVYPTFMKRSKVPQLIGGILFAMASFIALRYLLEEVISPYFFGFRNYNPDTTILYYIKDNIYFGSFYIIIAAAVWSSKNSFLSEKTNQALKQEAVKAELAFLKSQINPHFLYNTLNYIYSLAIPVSDKMAAAVLRLSDLMRYTLTESPDEKVSVVKEVEYLESYIELFRMRFDPSFYVSFQTEGVNDKQRIASLLLIPFVENAFKHGVVNDAANPVDILLEINAKVLSFTVKNKINNNQKDRSSGVGMVNIQRRLELIYPEKYTLAIENHDQIYQTRLTIKL
ncbi:MAG: histidine kinase [Pedobacter sp.]|nr:MAG: histidine kinase [Pedobacter sp.]